MNLIPTPSFSLYANVDEIRKVAAALVENFQKELDEINSKLSVVLDFQSPFLIQKVLNDDPAFIKNPRSVEGRLDNAKIDFENNLKKYYWQHLCSFTTEYFYPKFVSQFGPKYFYTQNHNWGQTYLPFTLENVEAFLDKFLLKPYTQEAIEEIIRLAKPLTEIGTEITVAPFSVESRVLNSYVTGEHFAFVLCQLKYSDNEDWLETARKLKFALEDFTKTNEDLRLARSEHRMENHKIGAVMHYSFIEFLALPKLDTASIIANAPPEADIYNIKSERYFKLPEEYSDLEYLESWHNNQWVVSGFKLGDIKDNKNFVPFKKLEAYALVDWVGGQDKAESILYDTLDPEEDGFWYWDIKGHDHSTVAMSEFSVHKNDLRKALAELTEAKMVI